MAVIAAIKYNKITSRNTSPHTQNTTRNTGTRYTMEQDQEQDQIFVRSDVTYSDMRNIEF